MEFCLNYINNKSFHRFYFGGLVMFTGICISLILLLLATETREHDDFKCNGGKDSDRDKCYEKYNSDFNKEMPLYCYIILIFGLVLLVSVIYSLYVTARVDDILKIGDDNVSRSLLQQQTYSKNKVFTAYFTHLIVRFVFLFLFLVLQWGLLYPTVFPKEFSCDVIQPTSISFGNNSEETFKTKSKVCESTKALPKTISGFVLFVALSLFVVSTLVELLHLYGKGKTRGFKTDRSFCTQYLNNLPTTQDNLFELAGFTVLPPLQILNTNSLEECTNSLETITGELEELSNQNDNNLVYYYISGNAESRKSKLARELGEHHARMHNNRLTFVMTLHGETNETLFESYVDFVRRVGCDENVVANICALASERDAKIRLLRSQVAQKINKFKPWLIIVDNVENLQVVQPLLPDLGSSEWKGGLVIVVSQDATHIPQDSQFSKHLALNPQVDSALSLEVDAALSLDHDTALSSEVESGYDRFESLLGLPEYFN